MIIRTDEEGKKAIESIADVALKSGGVGIDQLSRLLAILQTIKVKDPDENLNPD